MGKGIARALLVVTIIILVIDAYVYYQNRIEDQKLYDQLVREAEEARQSGDPYASPEPRPNEIYGTLTIIAICGIVIVVVLALMAR